MKALTSDQLTVAWQSASLLLGYPDSGLSDSLDLVRRCADTLPAPVAGPLRYCAEGLDGVPLVDLQAEYVDTFDNRRRHNLFLTYFAYGDTRKRGLALLRFKQTYLASGVELADDELPDHLCVVLEYAATVDQVAGRQLVLDHRAGLELLKRGLDEAGSRWTGAVAAVSATLPPLRGDEVEAVRRLAAEGPPEEEVGLTPYAAAGEPVPLPMPTLRGVS